MKVLKALFCAALMLGLATLNAQAQLAVTPIPSYGKGSFLAATVGTSHAQVAAAATTNRLYIMLHNPSASSGNTIYCYFGGTATVAGGGTLSIAPGQYVTWEGSFVPNDALDCIATGAGTPMTYGIR